MTRFLIIGPAWIGDMVMAQGLFIALKQQYAKINTETKSDIQIDVIAPDWTRPLLERMPEVNQILSLPFKHREFSLQKRWNLGKSLRSEKYDQAIVLPNSWKSAIIPYAANIPIRTGWLGEMRYGLLNNIHYLDKQKYPLMIQRFIALSLPHRHPCESGEKPKLMINTNQRDIAVKKYTLDISEKIIALCPGAEFGSSKRWPENYYAEIANILLDKNIPVWLMGSQKDKIITDQINHLTQNRCENLAGKTSLSEAIDLLSLASMVITNDSGLMHIAAALDRPIIALYGSTDPGFTPPLSNPDQTKILAINPEDLNCRPCFQRECPLKHHKCMKDLSPTRVLEVINACGF